MSRPGDNFPVWQLAPVLTSIGFVVACASVQLFQMCPVHKTLLLETFN